MSDGRYHSPLGPSKAHRWARCPASVNASKDIADEATQAALDGTVAHERAAGMAKLRLTDTCSAPLPPVDPEWLPHLDDYVAYIEQFVDEHSIVMIEEEVHTERVTGIKGDTGSLDAAVLNTDALHIFDLKFGVGDTVAAEDAKEEDIRLNPQLAMYADGVLEDHGFLLPSDPEFPVALHIFQPRREHISRVDTTMREVRSVCDYLQFRASLTRSPVPPFNPGEKQCRWCPIRGSCAARARWVMSDFEIYNAIGIDTLSDAEIAKIGEKLGAFRRWRDDVLTELGKRTLAGKEVGYKFVRGSSKRVITEQGGDKLTGLLGEKAWTKPEPELIGIGAAEKLIGKKHPFWTEEGNVFKPLGGIKLVPVSHSGQAVQADASDDFDIETAKE